MAERRADPSLFVVLGGTGDLMRRKLLPALYQLCNHRRLGERFRLLGVARNTEFDDVRFRAWGRDALHAVGFGADEGLNSWCDQCLFYQSIGEEDVARFESLKARIERIERDHALPGNRTFYLVMPPTGFQHVIESFGAVGLNDGPGWTRIVIEKPFGHDLASARDLNQIVHRHFEGSQIYRIDHYLGKEAVQNLLVLRFANPVFESAHREAAAASADADHGEVSRPPVSLFQPYEDCHIHANALVLTLQPDEGFDLLFEVKTPGQGISMQSQNLHFRYAEAFGPLPEGYETLLFDILTGDETLFVRGRRRGGGRVAPVCPLVRGRDTGRNIRGGEMGTGRSRPASRRRGKRMDHVPCRSRARSAHNSQVTHCRIRSPTCVVSSPCT